MNRPSKTKPRIRIAHNRRSTVTRRRQRRVAVRKLDAFYGTPTSQTKRRAPSRPGQKLSTTRRYQKMRRDSHTRENGYYNVGTYKGFTLYKIIARLDGKWDNAYTATTGGMTVGPSPTLGRVKKLIDDSQDGPARYAAGCRYRRGYR